jgi:hypothetical protein
MKRKEKVLIFGKKAKRVLGVEPIKGYYDILIKDELLRIKENRPRKWWEVWK